MAISLAAAGAGDHGADRRLLLFLALGKGSLRGLQVFFVEPVKAPMRSPSWR